MRPVNQRWRYIITSSLTGRTYAQNDPWVSWGTSRNKIHLCANIKIFKSVYLNIRCIISKSVSLYFYVSTFCITQAIIRLTFYRYNFIKKNCILILIFSEVVPMDLVIKKSTVVCGNFLALTGAMWLSERRATHLFFRLLLDILFHREFYLLCHIFI